MSDLYTPRPRLNRFGPVSCGNGAADKETTMTTNAKHTPGPWVANRYDPDSPWTVISTLGRWVCKVSSDGNWAQQSPEEEYSNARLIAAGPDLLAVCKMEETYRALKGDDGKGEADLRESLGIGPREHIGNVIAAVRRAAIARADGRGM